MPTPIHFAHLVAQKAKKYASRTAVLYRDNAMSKWIDITWKELNERVRNMSSALLDFGFQEEDKIGICAQNMAQVVITDFAAYSLRGVVVPMYATASAEQIEYIIRDSGLKIICVGEQVQFDAVYQVAQRLPQLEKIVVYDNGVNTKNCDKAIYFSEFLEKGKVAAKYSQAESIAKKAKEEDLAMIMYTSGTTGEPKGVMLLHSALLETMRIHIIRLTNMKKGDTSLAFLPLSHIFERDWTYLCLTVDVKVYLNQYPSEIQKVIKEVRPTFLCSVPRFWEKIAAGVQEKINTYSSFKHAVVAWALSVGHRYNLDYKRIEKRAPLNLYLSYKIANLFVFSKLKKIVGIDKGKMFPVAGAYMDPNLAEFFISMGLPIVHGYGLTETSATVCCYPFVNYTIGSLGTLMPDIQVKIGEDNEILVKGKTVCAGYYKKPEATKEAFIDGWFRTGDAGKLEGDTLFMFDRIKDLFKTSNGKYIAPQQIETALSLDKFIDQAVVIGNNRNFVTAIIVPNLSALEQWAHEENIVYNQVDELLDNERVYQLIEDHIAQAQAEMAPYEHIKKFRLIKKGFSIESGEVTNTLKLRRTVIMQKYAQLIDQMYESVKGPLGPIVK